MKEIVDERIEAWGAKYQPLDIMLGKKSLMGIFLSLVLPFSCSGLNMKKTFELTFTF